MALLQGLRANRAITIVLITHDMDVARYGTRIVSIRDGQIVSDEANTPTRAVASSAPLSAVAG
jgi:putative ABC transport system ATP-binding protein